MINIEDADYDAEVTARLEESAAHLEAAEVLQALRIGQKERQESSKAGSQYSDYAAQQFSDVESSASRHNSTPIHSPPNTDIQQGSSPHTADTHRSHSRTSKLSQVAPVVDVGLRSQRRETRYYHG